MKTSVALLGLVLVTLAPASGQSQDGTIEGRVTSATGEVVVGATVTAAFVRFHDGREQVTSSMTRTTDDKGAYRFDDAIAGRYLLNALPPS